MISDCSYCGILELTEPGFLQDTLTLLQVVVPGAIVLTLWRIFVTNRNGPRGGITVIGLDDSSSIYSGPDRTVFGVWYCLIFVLTFVVGLSATEAFRVLRKSSF